MNPQVLTVTALLSEIKNTLEGEFQSVLVEGEVTNLSRSSAGHYYFNLSDPDSCLSVALFRMDALKNPHIRGLKDGDKVICSGPLNVYAKRGTFQLVAKRVFPSTGKGDLLAQFEELKKRLALEGLFDLGHKRPIPQYPQKIAVITSPEGAALQDFLNVFKRRGLWMDVVVIPSPVQGDQAPLGLRKALQKAMAHGGFDVIVFTRGGGSMEDLWAFNDEILAREVFQCPVPVISAVGHQVDYTILDYVADLRAETPTAAAEILTEAQTKVLERIQQAQKKLLVLMRIFISELRERTNGCAPTIYMEKLWKNFLFQQKRLTRCNLIDKVHDYIGLHEYHYQLDDLQNRLMLRTQSLLEARQSKLERNGKVLEALSPSGVLGRGYTYLKDEHGKIIGSLSSYKSLVAGEHFDIHFKDGHASAQVPKESGR